MGSAPVHCKDDGPKILVVEGKDDCNGIFHFAERTEMAGNFGIWAGDSDEQALAKFGGLVATSPNLRPRALGLVLDCDTSGHTAGDPLTRRWQQVENRLVDFGYAVPERPARNGTILESALQPMPRVGIWLMPDNSSEGMLEDFLLALVKPETRTYAEAVVNQAKADGHADFNELHRSKAVAHTILAWRNAPGRPIGIAMRTGAFNVESELATTFKSWLELLFK